MSKKLVEMTQLAPYPACFLSNGSDQVLVISDLHIGWEVALSEKGIHVPSQTDRLMEKLSALLNTLKPDRLIILGDIKHSVDKIEPEERLDVPRFFKFACKMVPRVQVVPGNHDGNIQSLLPELVEVISSRGFEIGDVGFFHGHTWPAVELLGCTALVVGHIHPVVIIKDPLGFRITRQVWVQAQCDNLVLAKAVLRHNGVIVNKKEKSRKVLREKFNIDLRVKKLVVIPSFNDLLGGQVINRLSLSRNQRFKGFIGPIMRSGSVNINKAETFLLDGTVLGSLDKLRVLS